MGEYHYSNDPKDTYLTILSVGTKSNPGLHATTQREVWTDDGDDSKSNAPFQMAMDAIQVQTTNKLEFRDDQIFINSSTDGKLDIDADTEVEITTGTLDVTATATTVSGTLAVTGAATFTAGLTSNGHITLGGGNDLVGSSTSDILINTNKFTVAGASGNTLVAGTLDVTGAATFAGAVTLGNATSDDITNTGRWVGSFVPKTDSSVDLGTASLQFANAHIDAGYIDAITVSGTSALAVVTASGAITGSSTVSGTTITASTAFVPNASDGAALGTSSLEFSDLFLADGAVINLGADQEVSLTHVHDSGILLSSGDKFMFGEAGEYISGDATDMTIASGGLITLDAGADIVLDGDGADVLLKDGGTQYGALTNSGDNLLIKSGSTTAVTYSGANATYAGTSQFNETITAGVDGTGYDVKFFGDTSGAYMLWDQSTDDLVLAGVAQLYLYDAGGGEHISGDGTNMTLNSGADINLTAVSDINIPASVGLTFGSDNEKIEADGSNNLTVQSGSALNLTAAAASTWKATNGSITIDAENALLALNGNSGVYVIGNSAEVDITTTGTIDLNSGPFTLDGSTLSIDGTDDSNITVDGSGKDLNLIVSGGGTQQLTLASAGTGANAMTLTASAGGIDITSSGGSGEDIDVTATGSINLTSSEDAADAIVMIASAGGIDMTAAGADGEDIDIVNSSGSINITAGESHAGAIYIAENGGAAGAIKIHADTSTADSSIYLLSDGGGIDIQAGKTGYGIKIGDDTSGLPITIGHSTSETTIGQNLTVAGNLSVSGTQSYTALSLSHGDDPIFTINNAEHAGDGGDNEGHCTIIFSGENASGTTVAQRAKIIVDHPSTGTDEKGDMYFHTNAGSEGTSPGVALKLESDNDAIFYGDVVLAATKKLYLDGGTHTYLSEKSADVVVLSVGGDEIRLGDKTGTNNAVFGIAAGDSMLSGATYNVMVGDNSGTAITAGDANTAVGYNGLAAAVSGSWNVALGYQAGLLTTGDGNTSVGASAGDALTTGSYNTIIGYKADASAVGAANQTLLGYDVQGIGDNYAVIGDGSTTRVYAADDVGATLYAGSATVQTSDRRIKENIKESKLGLEFINSVKAVEFTKKQPAKYPKVLRDKLYRNGRKPRVLEENEEKRKRLGFIAQDVEKVLEKLNIESDIVVTDDDTTLKNIAYSKMVAPLCVAIQELTARLEKLEGK